MCKQTNFFAACMFTLLNNLDFLPNDIRLQELLSLTHKLISKQTHLSLSKAFCTRKYPSHFFLSVWAAGSAPAESPMSLTPADQAENWLMDQCISPRFSQRLKLNCANTHPVSLLSHTAASRYGDQ